VEGESYKSAATELGIAFHTVAFSRTQLLSESRALEIRGRGQGAGVAANAIMLIPPRIGGMCESGLGLHFF